MEFFKNNRPAYKSAWVAKAAALPQAASNKLSSMLGSVFGGATPTYKAAGSQSAKSFSLSGLLSMFAKAPSYKTVPAEDVAEAPVEDDDADTEVDAEVVEPGEPSLDDEGAACAVVADEIVLL